MGSAVPGLSERSSRRPGASAREPPTHFRRRRPADIGARATRAARSADTRSSEASQPTHEHSHAEHEPSLPAPWLRRLEPKDGPIHVNVFVGRRTVADVAIPGPRFGMSSRLGAPRPSGARIAPVTRARRSFASRPKHQWDPLGARAGRCARAHDRWASRSRGRASMPWRREPPLRGHQA
jgi:hypothetical protein